MNSDSVIQGKIFSEPFPVPILLLAWRRPDKIRRLICALRDIKPSTLYLFCDGPRNESDNRLVHQVRNILSSHIDWPCHRSTYFSETHLGCSSGVSTAISWFFTHVPAGIILEDDCIPSASFFPYCQELLSKYHADTRIWCISGSNFQKNTLPLDTSYYFSRYPHCWGWATWSDRWTKYDSELIGWEHLRHTSLFTGQFSHPEESLFWTRIFDSLYYDSYPDSWAYRWFYTCLTNSALTILPCVNLVENIGFGGDATHTVNPSACVSTASDLATPLNHPSVIIRHDEADTYTYLHHLNPSPPPLILRILRRLKPASLLNLLLLLFRRILRSY